MLDCPVCPRTQIAEDVCPQCGADLKPLIRLAELRTESQKPPPPEKRRPPFVAAAMFAAGLAIFPVWQKLRPPPNPVVVKPIGQPPPPTVPQPPETLYTARAGDSFWSIAKEKYGIGEMWKTIRDDNKDRLRRPGRLQAGEQIRLRTVTISPK